MHSTVVAEVGSLQGILAVGDTQCMVFKDCDEGPFWLSNAERLSSKFDLETEPITREDKIKA